MKTCTLLFLIRDDEILLAMKKRGFGAGRYNGVGGKIEPGESIERAMIRECQEEIGVTPEYYWKVAEHDFVQNEAEPWHMYVHAYLCDKWQGKPVETEEMAPEWFKLDAIPYTRMWEDDSIWLPLVLQDKKLRCNFEFDQHDNIQSAKLQVVEQFED